MVLSFPTNPYINYYAANSKEFIALGKSAKQDFKPGKCFNLLPESVDAFAVKVEKYAKNIGFDFLLNMQNLFTHLDSNHMLETWNGVMDESILINMNETRGTRNWTRGPGDF